MTSKAYELVREVLPSLSMSELRDLADTAVDLWEQRMATGERGQND